MTLDELQGELASDKVRPVYLLAGDEALLRDDALAALRKTVLGDAPVDFNLDRLEGEALEGARLLDAIRMLPVLSKRRLVVVREPSPGRRRSKTLSEALAVAAEELAANDSTVLVVVAAQVDRREGWVKAIERHGARLECEAPRRGRALHGFIEEEARRQGLRLERGAAQLLAERVGPQLLMLRQELAKAALVSRNDGESERTVTRADIESTSCDVAEESVWELTDSIGEGRTGDAVAILGRLLGGGAAPVMVLGSLANHFRRLSRLRSGANVPGPPFVRRKLEAQASRYGAARLVQCLRSLHEADEALKGQGGLPAQLALERLLLALEA